MIQFENHQCQSQQWDHLEPQPEVAQLLTFDGMFEVIDRAEFQAEKAGDSGTAPVTISGVTTRWRIQQPNMVFNIDMYQKHQKQ